MKKDKNKRRTAPRTELPLVCPPDRAGMSPAIRYGGMACRMLMIFLAVFGLSLFVCDALRLEQQEIVVSSGFLALVSLGFVAVFSAMALSSAGLISGAVLLTGGLVALLVSSGEPMQLITRTVLTAKNVVLTRLYNLGYYGMVRYISDVGYSAAHGQEYYFKLAVVLLIAVIALVFTLSCIKRVNIVGPVVVSALLIGAVFTYNLSRTNWGVVLVIASFVGLIAMHTYDRIFTDEPSADRYDCETVIFPAEQRPTLPEGELTPDAARRARKQARREAREQARKHKKEGTQRTVEEELDSYFASSVKAARAPRDRGTRRTPEQRREARERARQVRAVVSYDRAVRTSRRAQGGFAAVGAFVLAMLLLLMPALTVTGSFNTIEAIDKKMEYYREYVTALLMGNDPILDELSYQNDKSNFEPHSTTATPLSFTGKKIMTVETQYTANVYLRGWIGTSYENGAWSAVSDEQLEAYRTLYGTTKDANEIMFNYFYSIMDSSVTEEKDLSSAVVSKLKYGLVGMQVNIDREETGDSLVYMPSFYRVDDAVMSERADSVGLREYGSADTSEVTFVDYFDGIYTGRKFMSELAYASVAYVTIMQRNDWYQNVAELIAANNSGYNDAYDQIAKYASNVAKGKRASIDSIVNSIFPEDVESLVSVSQEEGSSEVVIEMDYPRGRVQYTYSTVTGEMLDYKITKFTEFISVDPETGEESTYTLAFVPTGIDLCTRYRYVMTAEQKRELAYAYYWQYAYTDFVYDTYLTPVSELSDTVRNTLSSIVEAYDAEHAESNGYRLLDLAAEQHSESAEVYEARHKLVMAIVDHLKDNYTYTLTPTQSAQALPDGVDNFLAVTHEGYCTQYASSLALMLRAAGIPARYVEGYVACDFNRNYNTEAAGRYIATVRDYNAHSWVEVWYDGVGWVQYEATSVYYDDMYVTQTGTSSGSSRPWYVEPNEETEEDELLGRVASALTVSEGMVEVLRDDLRLLIGAAKYREQLDYVEQLLAGYRATYEQYSAEYEAHRDDTDYSSDGLMTALTAVETDIEELVTAPLALIDGQIEALQRLNGTIRIIMIIVLVAALLVALVIWLDRRARRAENERMQLLAAVEAGEDAPAHRRETAHSIIAWLSELLAAYGSAPRAGEFRDDYARRLEDEYINVFGRLVRTGGEDGEQTTELVSDTDLVHIFEAIAAEEFGHGMRDDELREVAIFCRRIRGAAPRRLTRGRRVYYHFVKRVI